MTTNDKPSKALAELGFEDPQISLESTLARVAVLRSKRSRRRIMGASLAGLAALALCWWLLTPSSSLAPTPTVVGRTSFDPANAATPSHAPAATPLHAPDAAPLPAPTAVPSSAPAVNSPIAPSQKTPAPELEFPNGPLPVRHDVVLKALDFDKEVYEEITTIVDVNDDVVMTANNTSKQTCLQVVCEGGEARNLYCWAPSPSPVMITSPNGRKMMRVEGGLTPSSHLVALGTRLNSDSVLVWYEASPSFQERLRTSGSSSTSRSVAAEFEQSLLSVDLQRCSPSKLIDGSIRLDVTKCSSHERVVSVDLSDLAGRPIHAKASYSYEGDGRAVILLSSVPAGVAYVRMHAANGTMDTFPVALP